MHIPKVETTEITGFRAKLPNITYWELGNALLETGLLADHGFLPWHGNTDEAYIIVAEGVRVERVRAQLQELYDLLVVQGRIKLPKPEPTDTPAV